MTQEDLITALYLHADQVITPEVARAIAQALFPERGLDPRRFAPREVDGVVFQAESLRAIQHELHEQHVAHWGETERYRAGSAFTPDYEHMAQAERAGMLLQLTAREQGRLVGNLRAYLYRDLHTQELGATEDTLYLAPSARRGLLAAHFIEFAEACLAQLGVVDAYVDAKILHDPNGKVVRDVGSLMRRRRWAHVANRFHKRLTKE